MALTGRDKAMILLSVLGSDSSAGVMQYLSPEAADQIAGEINHLPSPSPEALQEILEEVQSAVQGEDLQSLPAPIQESVAQRRPRGSGSSDSRVLAGRLHHERSPILAFVASGLSSSERELFLAEFPDRRREIEQLIRDHQETPLGQVIRQSILQI